MRRRLCSLVRRQRSRPLSGGRVRRRWARLTLGSAHGQKRERGACRGGHWWRDISSAASPTGRLQDAIGARATSGRGGRRRRQRRHSLPHHSRRDRSWRCRRHLMPCCCGHLGRERAAGEAAALPVELAHCGAARRRPHLAQRRVRLHADVHAKGLVAKLTQRAHILRARPHAQLMQCPHTLCARLHSKLAQRALTLRARLHSKLAQCTLTLRARLHSRM